MRLKKYIFIQKKNIIKMNYENHFIEERIRWFEECDFHQKKYYGGKCTSLGELSRLSNKIGFQIGDGFALSTFMYDSFLEYNKIDKKIEGMMKKMEENMGYKELEEIGEEIRGMILSGKMREEDKEEIWKYYEELGLKYKMSKDTFLEVSVRSSAICEDSETASFAGQQDTYLNIYGKEMLIQHIIMCYASLYNTRAISYRLHHKIRPEEVKMSVAIQKMVRSDLGSAGVAFSVDTESGYDKAIIINSSFGLGELVVSGGVKPDEFIVDKRLISIDPLSPCILSKKMGDKKSKIIFSDEIGTKEIQTTIEEENIFSLHEKEIQQLAWFIYKIEEEYCKKYKKKLYVDIEFAYDGKDIYILQTRPETIYSNEININKKKYVQYQLKTKNKKILEGIAVGEKISDGRIKKIKSIDEIHLFEKGDILVTDMTTPDWEPIMKISSGIITSKGGRTCHAAIVARELGINAIVGCSSNFENIENLSHVTMDCSEGEKGIIYEGKCEYEKKEYDFDITKSLPTNIMLNVANPDSVFVSSLLPNDGVGLLRMEFIIMNHLQYHPLKILNMNLLEDDDIYIKNKIRQFEVSTPREWYIKELSMGIAKIASAFYPKPVILRMSDFKSNEYKSLKGGDIYEPNEENPMIGWRGCSRYYDEKYKEGFQLECEAVKYVREEMKMTNLIVMLPFCRTPEELIKVKEILKENGLERGKNNFELYMMCEIPSNVIESDLFAPHLDGISIGGNDLLQLTLGLDRDSELIQHIANYENISYQRLIKKSIEEYKKMGVKVGYCGQQPSDSISFCHFLIQNNIDSLSVTSDSLMKTLYHFYQ